MNGQENPHLVFFLLLFPYINKYIIKVALGPATCCMLLSFLSEKDVPANTVKTYDVHLYTFLTWTVDAGEWSASRPGRSNPWERALSTH